MVKNKNQELRENRRQQIMQTAMELFVEKGFVTASVSDIAKKCGISKGIDV
ncbi:MAG: TetR/AcrR family transcriptional regulator [Prevotellaceae bacterium]|nr:TetR/AcrR family transcriptional regulator [Prevotellaceae bacterium]